MKSLRNSIAAFAAFILLASATFAADPSGTWSFQIPAGRGGRGGGGAAGGDGTAPAAPAMQDITVVLTLTNGVLAGSQTSPGRGGGDPVVVQIANASFAGDVVTFSVAGGGGRGGRGGGQGGGDPAAAPATPPMTVYTGRLSADGNTITGTRTPPGGRGGEPMPVEWIARKTGPAPRS